MPKIFLASFQKSQQESLHLDRLARVSPESLEDAEMCRLFFGFLLANGTVAISLLWWQGQRDPSAVFLDSLIPYAFLVLIC